MIFARIAITLNILRFCIWPISCAGRRPSAAVVTRKIPRLAPGALEILKIGIGDVREIMERMVEELRDIPRM
jgi:hypothetical protein